MPLYDYECESCGESFEARAGVDVPAPPCPVCGKSDTRKVISLFSGPFTTAMRGYTARKSNATRAAREEQRAARKEERRLSREQQGP
jgi:putative FmdB family regulatory protein